MLQPKKEFCSCETCPSKGQVGKGNIIIHDSNRGLFKCKVCNTTFSQTKQTMFHGLKTPKDTVILVLTLLTFGCPIQAIVKAFGFACPETSVDKRTVSSWIIKAGLHCEELHQHLVVQPQKHRQVQADELQAKCQGFRAWIAMAISIKSRLWLGGIIDRRRSRELIYKLLAMVAQCCVPNEELLLTTDGLKTYIKQATRCFRVSVRTGKKGRPKHQVWENFVLIQGVKSYVKNGKRCLPRNLGGICHGVHRLFCAVGEWNTLNIKQILKDTQGEALFVNTAYIERINASFRSGISALMRRSRYSLKSMTLLNHWMFLYGTVYNFCTIHQSLRKTPAQAAGLTKEIWSIEQVLCYKVPCPLWQPPKKRGRTPNHIKELINKWLN